MRFRPWARMACLAAPGLNRVVAYIHAKNRFCRSGFMHTVFAPTNTAVHEMLETFGYGYLLRSPYPDPDQEAKSLFRKIVSAHLAPPLPGTEALWTSPFLVQGTTIRTGVSSTSFSLQVSQGPNQAVNGPDGIVLQASNGQASITSRLLSGNHESCKVPSMK